MTVFLAPIAGSLVGLTLGLIGGGGSIMATPLLLYLVGMSPHVAVGTGAVAVSANALLNFVNHARAGNVRWLAAGTFAATGIAGAFIGSSIGKAVDGDRLVLLFAILMLIVGMSMLRPLRNGGTAIVALTPMMIWRVAAIAFCVGFLAGFFGIGGGFLIVPALIFATDMPIINAIGSSLLAVASFGLATALNYSLSGLVDWSVAAEFTGGGIVGGWIGTELACYLAARRGVLNRVFAVVIFVMSFYIIWRSTRQT